MTEHPDEPTVSRRRTRLVALVLTAGLALAVVVAVVLSRSPSREENGSRPDTSDPAAAAAAQSPSTSAAPVKQPVPVPTPSPAEDARAQAELAEVAALLDTPLVLSSPAQWDQWLPEGKPYPGASTEEDMATCPRLSDRLGSVLGVGMSYWTGTLPGQGGCTWATVPLSYDGPYDYAYTASVGFLADGTTTEELRRGFYHRQGQICPGIDAPSAGAGAVLVRCEAADGTEYVVAVRDSRRTDGVWILMAKAQDDEPHPTTDVLTKVLEGVTAAYG